MLYTAYLICGIALTGCQSLPSLEGRSESHYLDIPAAPAIETVLNPKHSGTESDLSGIYLLEDAHDAFVARATLINSAQYTLDLQYYIWQNDISGKLLFNMLHRAAERGVRIRLLLDDNNTGKLDNLLAALNQHPNIEIRLFNPFTTRRLRALGYLTDFPRLNRRMHNKSLTADNKATIIGGRNIGDEYFNIAGDTVFADLDILATGSVVTDVSRDFDRYWASKSSYPLERIIPHADIAQGLSELEQSDEGNQIMQRYRADLAHSPLQTAIESNRVPWQYTKAQLISDNPGKGLNRDRNKPSIAEKISNSLKSPQHEIYLVSPYFVPTKAGMEAIRKLRGNNVAVTVLTNSLQATDVAAVHSGYSRYRKPLLESGVALYELKPNHAVPSTRDRGLTGSSATSLHAKTFIVDKQRVFIGSLNLDPRSARLNTEMGVVLESPQIASAMQRTLVDTTPEYAYKVTLNQYGKLQWHDPESGQTLNKEPEAGFWRRLGVKILSILPIEGLL
ncbi:phospholipase D family protein [Neisseria sp. S1]|uniref:phospholipase D family protein n=1 Tax=Neisseria sp. S1 TaxID=3318354 RepID=UPI003A86F03A